MTGAIAGKILALSKMPCGSDDNNLPIEQFTKTQLPRRVCFSAPVNKEQGQSFKVQWDCIYVIWFSIIVSSRWNFQQFLIVTHSTHALTGLGLANRT